MAWLLEDLTRPGEGRDVPGGEPQEPLRPGDGMAAERTATTKSEE